MRDRRDMRDMRDVRDIRDVGDARDKGDEGDLTHMTRMGDIPSGPIYPNLVRSHEPHEGGGAILDSAMRILFLNSLIWSKDARKHPDKSWITSN